MEWSESDHSIGGHPVTSFSFVSFLSIAQRAKVDFLPITSHQGLKILGEGATTEVKQSIVHAEQYFAFKNKPHRTSRTNAELLTALCTEILILRHPPIQEDPHIVDILGVSWEQDIEGNDAWPILVFPKAEYGSLKTFFDGPASQITTARTKLKLCSDIIKAVQKIHACNIVHGDLKPENILIFKESISNYAARLTDFGFSCYGENEDTRVRPPKSALWCAPEWHHRGSSIKNAKLMDVFSLGMLCLWVLIEHDLQESTVLKSNVLKNRSWAVYSGRTSIDALYHWKQRQFLPKLAAEVLECLEDISAQEKTDLLAFFNGTLQHNYTERESDITCLTRALRMPVLSDVFSLGKCDTIDSSAHQTFRLVAAIPQLSLTSYKIRSKILTALESTVELSKPGKSGFCCQLCSQNIAFQLAVASHLGFGGLQDEIKTHEWLMWSSREIRDLNEEINDLRTGQILLEYTGEFERLKKDGFIHIEDFAELDSGSGLYSRFEEAYSRESKTSAQVLGDSNVVTILLEQNLASILKGRYAYAEAALLEEEILDKLVQNLDINNPMIQKAKLRLGSTYCDLERYQDALDLQDVAFRQTKAIFGDTHPTTLSAAASIASTLWRWGNWEEAKSNYLQLATKTEHINGSQHPQTLALQANLAMAQKKGGNVKEAEILERDIVKVCLNTLGPDHTMTWMISSNLAQTYMEQGQYEEAEKTLTTLPLQKRPLTEMHPEKLKIFNILALAYCHQHRFSEAQDTLVATIKAQEESFGIYHPDSIRSSLNFVKCLNESNLEMVMSVIKNLYERCSRRSAATDTTDAFVPLSLKAELAALLKQHGLWNEAEELENEILSRRRTILGLNNAHTLEAMAVLCETLAHQKKYEQADELEPLLSQDQLRKLEKKDIMIFQSIANLGSIYIDENELDRAQRVLERVWDAASSVLGSEHSISLTALSNLASAYALKGMLEEAYTAYCKVLRIKFQFLGEDNPSTQTTILNFKYFCDCVECDADQTIRQLQVEIKTRHDS